MSNTEFVVGEWYKADSKENKGKFHYLKVCNPNSGYPRGEGISSAGIYRINHGWACSDTKEIALRNGPLTDLSEIQDYLPEGHVDKVSTKKFIIGKWYKAESLMYSRKFYYMKVSYVSEGGTIKGEGIELNGKYVENDTWNNSRMSEQALSIGPLEDLSEIQMYLPKHHVDNLAFRIPESKSFIIGEWYKSNVSSQTTEFYYLKVLEVVNAEMVRGSCILVNKEYREKHFWNNTDTIKQALELGPVCLSEIQEWLPEHHEDIINSTTFLQPVLEHRLLL